MSRGREGEDVVKLLSRSRMSPRPATFKYMYPAAESIRENNIVTSDAFNTTCKRAAVPAGTAIVPLLLRGFDAKRFKQQHRSMPGTNADRVPTPHLKAGRPFCLDSRAAGRGVVSFDCTGKDLPVPCLLAHRNRH